MSIQSSVKDWVSVDNKIRSMSEQLKELREQRKQHEEQMVSWAHSATTSNGDSVQRPVIKISDGKLRFVETKQTAPLSLKYVEERLRAILPTPDHDETVQLIMNDLRVNREVKIVQEVKRVYDK